MRVRRTPHLTQVKASRPTVEALEDRWLPSVPGSCSAIVPPSVLQPAPGVVAPMARSETVQYPVDSEQSAHQAEDRRLPVQPDNVSETIAPSPACPPPGVTVVERVVVVLLPQA